MRAICRHSIDQRSGVDDRELAAARTDTVTGMLFSQPVAYCIILTAAALHAHGRTGIQTAATAAEALAPFAGPVASILFAAGFIGTGLLAIPVLSASAGHSSPASSSTGAKARASW